MDKVLLVTDVLDAAGFEHRLGAEGAHRLWTEYDRRVRDLVGRWRGREGDRTDGFLLLFDDVNDAVGLAVDLHREAASLGASARVPFSVRVGIHRGPVAVIEVSAADRARGAKPIEVEGIAKPTAARVMSAARGGQTLITAEAAATLRRGALAVASHGRWRVKGVAEPMELFEVAPEGSAFVPPPDGAKVYRVVWTDDLWRPVREVPRTLPAELDPFVGRDDDLSALAAQVHEGARLVTVTGPAGSGKSRLVRRYGWVWLGDYPGGAYWCDLSNARSPIDAAQAVASGLEAVLGRDDPCEQVRRTIAARGPCLVVLDNFDPVVRHAPATLGRWLEGSLDAVFVLTSRERAGLASEHLLPLEPLPRTVALRLFDVRARAADPRFELEPYRAEVEAIVELLDGLPLAIELAAARVRVLRPPHLLARLRDRFKLLASGRAGPARHATLRAAVDWSWDMLEAWERAALAQASVFRGGFSMQAAQAVIDLGPWTEAPWTVDVVHGLVDKSLVHAWSSAGGTVRLGLYETLRDYAAEKLSTAGAYAGSGPDAARDACDRHLGHFATLGTAPALRDLDRDGGAERRIALGAELANLVEACGWAVARDDGEAAAGTLLAACAVLESRGPAAVGSALADEVLAMRELRAGTRARVLRVAGWARHLLGRHAEAREHYEGALRLARENGDAWLEGRTLASQGFLDDDLGRPVEALARYEQALAVQRAIADEHGAGITIGNVAVTLYRQGERDLARERYHQALAILRPCGDRRVSAWVLTNLATLELELGRLDLARSAYLEALALHREVGNVRLEGMTLANLGVVETRVGAVEDARARYLAAIELQRRTGDPRSEAVSQMNLGVLDQDHGDPEHAVPRHERALAVFRQVGDARHEGIAAGNLGGVALLRGRLDEARAHLELAVRRATEVGDPMLRGLWLALTARVELRANRREEAAALAAESEPLLRASRSPTELARWLCTAGELALASGDRAGAEAHLAEATSLVASARLGPTSLTAREVASLRSQVGLVAER